MEKKHIKGRSINDYQFDYVIAIQNVEGNIERSNEYRILPVLKQKTWNK